VAVEGPGDQRQRVRMAAALAVVGLMVVIVGAFVVKPATNAPAELGATTAPTQATAPTHAPTASGKTASDRWSAIRTIRTIPLSRATTRT
jgi:hypothetical protein